MAVRNGRLLLVSVRFVLNSHASRASPRLKDAEVQPDDLPRLYIEIVVILRAIFHRCRLVHADFSEYNIL